MNLRDLRKSVGLTQLVLANETGISRMRLSLAECGYVTLHADEQERIKQVLKREMNKRHAAVKGALMPEKGLAAISA